MKTELLYLSDTYLFKETATFLEMREHEKGTAVILDRTIFYPQGGGQPSDTGYIDGTKGRFRVDFAGLDADGGGVSRGFLRNRFVSGRRVCRLGY